MEPSSSYSQLIEPVRPLEMQPLLPPPQSNRISFREKLARANFLPRHLCLPSKAAVLILFWTLVVSAIYSTAEESTMYAAGGVWRRDNIHTLSKRNYSTLIAHLMFTLILLFYPIAGFMADVFCGRYKTVITSLIFLLCAFACFGLITILIFSHIIKSPFDNIQVRKSALFLTLSGSGMLFSIIGLSGYQANFIQLGLDQLLEAPSEYLSLFVHWEQWFTELGTLFPQPIFLLLNSCRGSVPIQQTVLSLLPFFFLTLALTLLVSYFARHWFYREPVRNNPYQMVFRVLNFTRKHKYPLQRSAFTYNENPSRIDYAKEKYGGPFTTEQVEDVKTLFRILTVLLLIGPVFLLEVPLESTYNLFTDHTVSNNSHYHGDECSWRAVVQNVTMLRNLAAVISFPMYIWLIYTVLRRCIPRMLVRIWIGELLFLLGILAMFLVDSSGHVRHYKHTHQSASCMFIQNNPNHSFYLDLPWAVSLLPAFLMQAAITIIVATTFEFISAQSPHSMKGLLVGMFYAIRGTFKFLGAISILPFSMRTIWASDYMTEHLPAVTNCGFGYLLFNCAVGLLSLILFTVAAKRYRYRERDDPPYDQTIVESVWAS